LAGQETINLYHTSQFSAIVAKIKLFEISETIEGSFALPSHSLIHKKFPSRYGVATILPHCHRLKNIAPVV
jgi:hypothetical protein